MRTYPYIDHTGRMYAFDIDNIGLLTPLAKRLEKLDGVTAVRKRGLFRRPSDIHIRFIYHGTQCVVLEAYSDNSRLWIGPENAEVDHIDMRPVEEGLRHDAPLIFDTVGDLRRRFVSLFRSNSNKNSSGRICG